MKRFASKALTGEEDLTIIGDLATIALEEGHLEIAAEYSEGAIEKISEKYDASRVRFYCILIEVYY